MNLIAFTGLAGSGKSSASLGLVKAGWHRISFADTIRAMILALGVTPEELMKKHEPIAWLGGNSPRQLMQTLGTEWGRQLVDPNVWVSAARKRILKAMEFDCPGVVLDDCRFDNEADDSWPWRLRDPNHAPRFGAYGARQRKRRIR